MAIECVEVGQVWYNGAARQIQKALFSVAPAQTDSVAGLPAAQGAGLKIHVVAYELHGGSVGSAFQFNTKPAGAGSAISPVMVSANFGQKLFPPSNAVLYSTAANEGLSITTGSGTGNSVGTVFFIVAP